jgi:two-component system, OmpR family, sensor kinase
MSRRPRRPRLRRPKLRTQVLAGVLTITLVALAAFDVFAVSALHRYLVGQTEQKLYSALTVTQERLEIIVSAAATRPVPVLGDYDIAFVPLGKHRPVILQHAVGQKAEMLTPALRAREAAGFATAAWEVVRTVRTPDGTLVASVSLSSVDATVARFRLIVIIGSAAAGLLILGGVALVMRRGLRPIESMAVQADRVSTGDLTDRVACGDGRSEVGRLGTALNGMLARIEASVTEREASQELMRRFFADASHELRTPLASLRANAELYQQGALRQRPQVDEAMRRIALEAQRMSRLVDDMLRLARLDQHPARQDAPVDLAGLIDDCVQRARIADPARSWQAIAEGISTVTGDEELLGRAVDNLLTNVRTHTPQGTVATVTATSNGDDLVIEVSDDGPGVPDSELPRIFDRFYRGTAPSGRPGSGLGLAIVAEIAAAHDGIASAARNEPHGLRITLTLPARDHEAPSANEADSNGASSNGASTAQSRASAVV